ncbi:MAG: InlB B-repeat-containing protein [Clostridia bacterium]|nr:InlB B-repeat-containing protein [Clostridia bacterium]
MKKSKFFVATLTAAALVIGSGAFAACNNTPEGEGEGGSTTYEITFDANGGAYAGGETTVKVSTDTNGVVAAQPNAPVRENYDFVNFNTKEDGTGTAVTYGSAGYKFTANATVYAQWVDAETGEEYTITLDAGEGTLEGDTSLTTVNGKLASLPTPTAPENKTFSGWYTAVTDGVEVTAEYSFTADATIYALYADDQEPIEAHTITLIVGEGGTVAEGSKLTYTTVNGKIDLPEGEYLPIPTANTAHWHFMGWYDSETDGNEIDETEAIFREDTTLYAVYGRDNGLWIGDTFKATLSANTGATLTGGLKAEYWLGGGTVELEKDTAVSIYLNGKLLPLWISGTYVETTSSTQKTTVVVTEDAKFEIYLKDYTSASNPNNWSVQFVGTALNVDESSDIPEGSDAVTITATNGTLTLYFVTSADAGVGAEDFSKYVLYAYNDALFGDWTGSVTKGAMASEMTGAGSITATFGLIVRWGSGFGSQTADIKGLEANGAYIIKLPAAHNGTATVTKLNLGTGEVTE